MRVRYPSVVAGAIAASAPVGAFVSRFTRPPFDPSTYWKVLHGHCLLAFLPARLQSTCIGAPPFWDVQLLQSHRSKALEHGQVEAYGTSEAAEAVPQKQ